MSSELIGINMIGVGIVLLGIGQIAAIVVAVRGFREISRIQRALAGLVVQESEQLQTLFQSR